MNEADIKKMLDARISRERAKELLIELVKVPSPQTELLEDEPLLKAFIKTAVDAYGESIGLAFQIVDDILDVEGESAALGKTAGKDAAAGKPTYPSIYGLAESRRLAASCMERAVESLERASLGGQLAAIARWIVSRTN